MKTLLIAFLLFTINASFAGQVKVVKVDIQPLGNHQYRFDVTLLHDDQGWDHYANRWEILDDKGNILATRTLYHPHVNEQPFTRSLSTTLPENIKNIIIRGHDNIHQYTGNSLQRTLP